MKRLCRFHLTAVMLFALFAAQTLFLWMFFVAGGLEQMAELGHIVGSEDMNVRVTVFEFAASWRHGMTEGWPLYMPGFFVTAVIVWCRAIGLRGRRIVWECVLTGMLAVIAAWLLSSASAGLVLDALHAETGMRSAGDWPGVTGRVLGQGLFTLINWNSFVLASQFAILEKSFWPLFVPAALSVVLMLIRPVTVGDFVSLWGQRTFEGDSVAMLSALLIPLLSVLLALTLRPSIRRRSAGSTQVVKESRGSGS